jgi:P-type Ca2+ transporter type 2C
MHKSKTEQSHTFSIPPFRIERDIAFISEQETLQRLNTCTTGLSTAEAAERLSRHGLNSIRVERPNLVWKLIRENFLHTMALLLWCAGTIAFAAQMPELGSAIWMVNLINGSFGLWQEYHAEKATEALRRLLPTTVNVTRDSKAVSIAADLLVPGDIVHLAAGDKVSADARLISSESLEVDQSTLTGESHPVRKIGTAMKEAPLHTGTPLVFDTANLLFAGTSVLNGHGVAVVYATGTATEFGRVARLTQTIADQPSPLQKEMARVTKIVSLIAVSVGVIIFGAAVAIAHSSPSNAFVFSMGMIVAFVPEGMLPTVTLSLALAVQRMAKRQALVKRLSSVEALGCTNIICTDKTGTLTQNKMTVTRVFTGGTSYNLNKGKIEATHHNEVTTNRKLSDGECLTELFRALALCNNAAETGAATFSFTGDPTEVSLMEAAFAVGCSRFREEQKCRRIYEVPFDSRRKRMSTVHETGQERIVFMKGSPATVLELCTRQQTEQGPILLTAEERQRIIERIDSYAVEGLRVLAAATKQINLNTALSEHTIENELIFLGLAAMYDPPRSGVPESVQKCHAAGIQIVMITGDYEVTAEAIARQTGIIKREDQTRIVTGAELDRITDPELVEIVGKNVLFARVNPEHKLRVVGAFQRCGKVVAVTGDGVNDAPALKKADIGVAMGMAGTDVAKEAADIILLDDNFASIVNAVEEGRAVYDNIKKFALYVFNSNMAEAVPFVVMLLSCGAIPLPLTVMQVLAIDLGTDMVPAIALGADPASEEVMTRRPRAQSNPLLSRELLTKAFFWYGSIESIGALSGYFFVNAMHGWPQTPLAEFGSLTWRTATSLTLACIVAAQIGAVFCCRSEHASLIRQKPFDNPLILLGVLVEMILLGCLIYIPNMQSIFSTAPLGAIEIGFALCWAPIMITLDELRKLIWRRQQRFKEDASVLG